jgi:hypothetical protein
MHDQLNYGLPTEPTTVDRDSELSTVDCGLTP